MAEVELSQELQAVEELLSSLVGMDVQVEESDAKNDAIDSGFVASYKNDTGEVDSFCLCDLAFSNSAGAALARIPNGFASDSTKAGECPENVQENLSEVLNVFSVLARGDRNIRLLLGTIYTPSCELSDEAKDKFSKCTQKSWKVTISGYDSGLLSLSLPSTE